MILNDWRRDVIEVIFEPANCSDMYSRGWFPSGQRVAGEWRQREQLPRFWTLFWAAQMNYVIWYSNYCRGGRGWRRTDLWPWVTPDCREGFLIEELLPHKSGGWICVLNLNPQILQLICAVILKINSFLIVEREFLFYLLGLISVIFWFQFRCF